MLDFAFFKKIIALVFYNRYPHRQDSLSTIKKEVEGKNKEKQMR